MYRAEEVHYLGGGIFTLNNDELRALASWALAKAPEEVVDYAMKHAVALMPTSAEEGCYIPEPLVRGKSILAFPETILEVPEKEAHFTVLHEIAHLWLGHKCPLLDGLTAEECNRQEEEANALAGQWLKGD